MFLYRLITCLTRGQANENVFAMRNLMLITLLFYGCWGQQNKVTEPVLPESQLGYESAPELDSYQGRDIATLYPEGGQWTLEVEYSVSQRVAGKPDLDVQAKAVYTLTGNAEGGPSLSEGKVSVRPDTPKMGESLKKAAPSLLQSMRPRSQPDGSWLSEKMTWKAVGQSKSSVVLNSESKSNKAWLLIDEGGVVRGRYQETGDEKRNDLKARQIWRITVKIGKKG